MNIQTKVIELLQLEFQDVALDGNSSSENTIGWDSQFQLVVIMIVEDEFNIMIPNDRLNELVSVSNIVKLITDLS